MFGNIMTPPWGNAQAALANDLSAEPRKASSELAAERGEGGVDLSTEGSHDGDDDTGNQSDKQPVLDRGGATLVVASRHRPFKKQSLENNQDAEHVGGSPLVGHPHDTNGLIAIAYGP